MSSPGLARRRRHLFAAVAFLSPNLIGVLTFTVLPVVFAIVLAFTNWDLRRHNMFREEPLQFVGIENFVRLFTESDFLRFLGNTLFFMMGIPFSIAGSLVAALLLSGRPRGANRRVFGWLLAAAGLVASTAFLAAVGAGASAMVLLLVGFAGAILIVGMAGGVSVYRTLFYLPHFTAGVATFLLWKRLYNPQHGPINAALRPGVEAIETATLSLPSGAMTVAAVALLIAAALLCAWALGRLRRSWLDGELGAGAATPAVGLLVLPAVVAATWGVLGGLAWALPVGVGLSLAWQATRAIQAERPFTCPPGQGFGTAVVLAAAAMVGQFVLVGLAGATANLPAMAADGLEPPRWIYDYHWAKPSLMIMALWAAVGSNNMLLYLAALTNVPGELYEAADIDGATGFARFWHVTWPQLAPTTFFISVMSVIYGLQGGFEMARTMTEGGPSGATTFLSYFIYIEGFETGRLSNAAATAWALFAIVLALTLINWKFGNKYVND